ncbi:hypothetical protein BU17DRAFT_93836 [Hysterangium stoloniferum]|nr:hypothetical protein BU17DRAFT_93836 [Hysterangium stoloniferum]
MQDDEAIKGPKAWCRESKFNHPDNVHLVAYTEQLKNLSRFHKTHTLKTRGHGQLRFVTATTSHDMDTSSQGLAFSSTNGDISSVSDHAIRPPPP